MDTERQLKLMDGLFDKKSEKELNEMLDMVL